MNKLIAVTVGDIKGIGIEILINLYKKKKITNFVLFTNISIIRNYLILKKLNIKLNQINLSKNKINFKKNFLNIYSYDCNSMEQNTYLSIKYSYNQCRINNYLGMVTLPLRKDLIIKKLNKNFIGHTEFLQKLDKKKYSNMIMYHKKIMITPITTHISIKNISKTITKNNFLYNQILNLHKTLIKDFNIKKPKLIISGLNPHAGENGKIGNEEIKIIKPVIKKIKNNKINLEGPISADSMINKINNKKYDCFIFILHDQALIPFKYISNHSGVNYTGNLDIIRTSPDHGTAYDLVGKKKVSHLSMINSFKLIKKISKNKFINEKSKKIFKPKFS